MLVVLFYFISCFIYTESDILLHKTHNPSFNTFTWKHSSLFRKHKYFNGFAQSF